MIRFLLYSIRISPYQGKYRHKALCRIGRARTAHSQSSQGFWPLVVFQLLVSNKMWNRVGRFAFWTSLSIHVECDRCTRKAHTGKYAKYVIHLWFYKYPSNSSNNNNESNNSGTASCQQSQRWWQKERRIPNQLSMKWQLFVENRFGHRLIHRPNRNCSNYISQTE